MRYSEVGKYGLYKTPKGSYFKYCMVRSICLLLGVTGCIMGDLSMWSTYNAMG